jgi:hypothetical protein
MYRLTRLPTALFAAALTLAATPAAAQTAAGPVRIPTLSSAGLAADAALPAIPGAAIAGMGATHGDARSDLDPPRVYASAPLSLALAFGGGAAGYFLGMGVLGCSEDGPRCAHGFSNAEYVTSAAGIALGAAAGAHVGGLRRNSRGRLGVTLLGAAAGTLPLLLADKRSDQVDGATRLSIAAAPLAAVVADYLVRAPRH